MSITVRIVVSYGSDQVQVYHPSPRERHSFVPNGRLVAQLRACPQGYRIYHAETGGTTLHHDYPHAMLAALALGIDSS